MSPPGRLAGLGERHELPSGSGAESPGRKRILAYFEGHRTLLFETKSEGDNLHQRPLLQILGDLSPRPLSPVIYARAHCRQRSWL